MENNSSQQPTQQITEPSVLSNHIHFGRVFLVLVVALLSGLMFGLIGYFLGLQKQMPFPTSQTATITKSTLSSLPPFPSIPMRHLSPVPTQTITTNFKLQQFDAAHPDVNKSVYQPFIQNILNKIPDNELIGMSCSYNYHSDPNSSNSFTYYTKAGLQPTTLNNQNEIQKLKNYISAIKKVVPDLQASDITYCKVTDGRMIIVSNTIGNNNRQYFAVTNNGSETPTFTTVENIPGGIFYACEEPLELTKTNNLYYKCGEGDGPNGNDYYFTIDLTKKRATQIASCSVEGDSTGNLAISCH